MKQEEKKKVVCPSLGDILDNTSDDFNSLYMDYPKFRVEGIRANGHDGYTFQRGHVYRLTCKNAEGKVRSFMMAPIGQVNQSLVCYFIAIKSDDSRYDVYLPDEMPSNPFCPAIARQNIMFFNFASLDCQIDCKMSLEDFAVLRDELEEAGFGHELTWDSGEHFKLCETWVIDEELEADMRINGQRETSKETNQTKYL